MTTAATLSCDGVGHVVSILASYYYLEGPRVTITLGVSSKP